MRKLAFAVALAVAALFAQGARAGDAVDSTKKAGSDAADATKKAGSDAAGATKKEATKVEQAGDRALNGSGSAGSAESDKKHSMWDGKHNFDFDGKIQSVSKDSITISREDLPPATLMVSPSTKIELDGDHASAQQLKQGQDVKASFNLNKEKPEAVEIKAKRVNK